MRIGEKLNLLVDAVCQHNAEVIDKSTNKRDIIKVEDMTIVPVILFAFAI